VKLTQIQSELIGIVDSQTVVPNGNVLIHRLSPKAILNAPLGKQPVVFRFNRKGQVVDTYKSSVVITDESKKRTYQHNHNHWPFIFNVFRTRTFLIDFTNVRAESIRYAIDRLHRSPRIDVGLNIGKKAIQIPDEQFVKLSPGDHEIEFEINRSDTPELLYCSGLIPFTVTKDGLDEVRRKRQ
jgi:hypothetical protein